MRVFSSLLLTLIVGSPSTYAATSVLGLESLVRCKNALESVAPKKIETLDDLLLAFSQGFVPNLKDKSQRDAFEIYRRMRFGDPNTNLTDGTLRTISENLTKHPELTKDTFRNYELEVQERVYPVTPELQSFIDSQVKTAGQIRSNLFQIEANLGFWKKLVQYQDPIEDKNLSKEERKKEKEAEKAKFLTRLDGTIGPSLRQEVANGGVSYKERGQLLYDALASERTRLKAEGKDIRPISQAIVDLVHTIGFNDPGIIQGLKSRDGLERINSYRRILSDRDSFAMQLGFPDHFEQVLREMQISLPSGINSSDALSVALPKIEDAVIKGAQIVKNQNSSRTVRHLSIVESPFRSCLGGSDCSSRTYLTRALDPNYHYFTLTDNAGFSSGHITVVLGDADQNETSSWKRSFGTSKAKVAFIDKVQNVSNSDLPFMMEAVRQSVLEKGYVLSLPENFGDHNGISNEQNTRDFIKKNIKTDASTVFLGFKPHAHGYKFPNEYSRAEQGLTMRPVSALELDGGVQLQAGEINQPWKHPGFKLDELVTASIKLKDGSNADKERYIPAMKAIKVAGLTPDPEFEATLHKWLSDKNESFQLRKQVLLYLWSEESKPLGDLLSQFGKTDQINVLQNLLDTPRYRDLILKKRGQLPSLIVKARTNKKVRETLLQAYNSKLVSKIENILDHQDVPDEALEAAIPQLEKVYSTVDIEEIAHFLTQFQNTSLEATLWQDLKESYVTGAVGEKILSRHLILALNSSDAVAHKFATTLLHDSRLAHYSAIQALNAIAENFQGDVGRWLTNGPLDKLKAKMMLSYFTAKSDLYESLLARLSASDRTTVEDYVNSKLSLGSFREFAAEREVSPDLFKRAKVESFEYTGFKFPQGGTKFMMGSPAREQGRYSQEIHHEVNLTKTFEMAATAVTQFEWYMVMGKNPSRFAAEKDSDGDYAVINGVSMNMNHPVEKVSWDDTQVFIKKLNAKSTRYTYRLATEAEMEYSTRGGTQTAYHFGDSPDQLQEYGYFDDNSGNRTHAVASKKPNQFGLYDMHGNVWEWVQDYWSDDSTANVTDPTGPRNGSNRVIRGGSWYNHARYSRSASRDYYSPGDSYYVLGFRLVRTPK